MSCKRDTQREAIVAGSTKAVGDLWSVSSLPELQVQHLPLAHRDKPSPEAHLRASLSDSSHSPLPGSRFSSSLYAPLHEHCNPYNLAPASLREYTPSNGDGGHHCLGLLWTTHREPDLRHPPPL